MYFSSLDLQRHIGKIRQVGETKELRHVQRAIRMTFSQYRRKITPSILARLIHKNFTDVESKNQLMAYLPKVREPIPPSFSYFRPVHNLFEPFGILFG